MKPAKPDNPDNPVVTIYITSWWARKGILVHRAVLLLNVQPKGTMAELVVDGDRVYVHKPHFHATLEEAQARVRGEAAKKIKSLKAQIERLTPAAHDPTTVKVVNKPWWARS